MTDRLLAEEMFTLRAEVVRLREFKEYVHTRLDAAGVPVDPESPHRAEGCRIGGRLDLVLDVWAQCRTCAPDAGGEG